MKRTSSSQLFRTRHLPSLLAPGLVIALLCLGALPSRADDWMTRRSTYTHDPYSGQRVDQYALAEQPLSPDQGNLVRSGFRHYRSTIQGSTSADNLHIVHEWGRPVIPYEHWRFPYRPFGVPYSQWGPPVPNVWSNFNWNGGFGPWGGAWPPPGPGNPPASYPGMGHWPQPPAGSFPGTGNPGAPGGYYPPAGGYGPPGAPYPNGQAWPLVPPYQPAPWYDGLYRSSPD